MTTFKLKCVGCGKVENRPADDCHSEMPICGVCYMPMILQTVTTKQPKARAR